MDKEILKKVLEELRKRKQKKQDDEDSKITPPTQVIGSY